MRALGVRALPRGRSWRMDGGPGVSERRAGEADVGRRGGPRTGRAVGWARDIPKQLGFIDWTELILGGGVFMIAEAEAKAPERAAQQAEAKEERLALIHDLNACICCYKKKCLYLLQGSTVQMKIK